MATPKKLCRTDKAHLLFGAFHAYNLKKKSDVCDDLREFLDREKLSGNTTIDDVLKRALNEINEIYSYELVDAIYAVIENDDIQYAQHLPEVKLNENNMSDKERNQTTTLFDMLFTNLQDLKTCCITGTAEIAQFEINKTKTMFHHYMEVIRCLVIDQQQ